MADVYTRECMAYCPNCGVEVEDAANFCPDCGQDLSGYGESDGESVSSQGSIDQSNPWGSSTGPAADSGGNAAGPSGSNARAGDRPQDVVASSQQHETGSTPQSGEAARGPSAPQSNSGGRAQSPTSTGTQSRSQSRSQDYHVDAQSGILRTLVRAVGALGVLSGFVLPIAIRGGDERTWTLDQFLAREPGVTYALTDDPVAAAAALGAVGVFAWLYATRSDGPWADTPTRAWALMAAGGAAFAAAPLGYLRAVPSVEVPPAVGLLTVFLGGVLLLASATVEFAAVLDVRWRDITAVASFLLVFATFPFRWFSIHGVGWDIDEDVVTYTIRPGTDVQRSQSPELTGLDLSLYGFELIQVVAAGFAVLLVILLARYVSGWTTGSLLGRPFSTDWLNALLVYAVAMLVYVAQPTGRGVKLHAHYQIASYALAVAFLAYVAPGVRRWWRRRTTG